MALSTGPLGPTAVEKIRTLVAADEVGPRQVGVSGATDTSTCTGPAVTHAGPRGDKALSSQTVPLVNLARGGDREAFGLLYEHYHGSVYRFLYYRVGAHHHLAEDFTSETFFRALRCVSGFQWQGRDFGAWLITIARNLLVDHFQAARTRLEQSTDDLTGHDTPAPGPEDDVLARFTYEALLCGLGKLEARQQKCLVLRFLQGKSIAETAEALERSEGAIKQLQRRAVRDLARLLPEGVR